MYVELPKKQARLVERYLTDNNLEYEKTEIQLKNMKEAIYHFNLDRIPASHLDVLKDIIEKNMPKEYRVRKWDQKHHTLSEEARGWFTGENTEETIVREG